MELAKSSSVEYHRKYIYELRGKLDLVVLTIMSYGHLVPRTVGSKPTSVVISQLVK